jgi:hypothetical protein
MTVFGPLFQVETGNSSNIRVETSDNVTPINAKRCLEWRKVIGGVTPYAMAAGGANFVAMSRIHGVSRQ